MPQTTKKYATAKWKELNLLGMEITAYERGFRCVFPGGEEIIPNFSFFSKEEREKLNLKHFLLDKQDAEWIQQIMKHNKEESIECLMSLKSFLKYRPDKKIYIRLFSAANGKNILQLILVYELLEILPLLLKQQKLVLDGAQMNVFESMCKSFKDNTSNVLGIDQESVFNATELHNLKQLLEALGINKELITVVPDILHERMIEICVLNCQKQVITWSPDGKDIMLRDQAILYIFQTFVCGVRWNKEYCKDHKNCKDDFKRRILKVMIKYASVDQKIFVSCDQVQGEIFSLMQHCTYSYQKDDLVREYLFSNSNVINLAISSSSYQNICYKLGLPSLPSYLEKTDSEAEPLPLELAQTFLMLVSIEHFVPPNMVQLVMTLMGLMIPKVIPELQHAIYDVMISKDSKQHDGSATEVQKDRIEKLRRDAERREQQIQQKKDAKKNNGGKNTARPITKETLNEVDGKPKDVRKIHQKPIEILNTEKDSRANSERTDKKSDKAITKDSSEMDLLKTVSQPMNEAKGAASKKPSLKTNELPVKKKDDETKNNEKVSVSSSNESKCCPKCLRTSQMCNETQRELKTTQNKLKMFESKAKRTDELEKKMKEKDKENEQLKKANAQLERALQKKEQEMDVMKTRIEKYEETETKLKQSKREKDELMKKVAQLEDQLKRQEQNSQVNQLEMELSEKDRKIADLQETNLRVTVRNEEQAKNIQNLLDRLTNPNININK